MVDYESMTRPELIETIRALEQKLSQAALRREAAGPDRDFALLEQERLLFFERSPYAMLIHDRETRRFLKVNDAALRLYGYSREEFLGMKRGDIRAAGEIPATLEIQRQREPTGYMHYRGLRTHRKISGELFEVEVIAHDILFKGRNARVTLIVDVTKHALAEGRLRQQKKLLDAVIDNLPVGLVIKDARSLRYLRRNRFSETMIGYRHDESVGKTAHDLYSPDLAKDLHDEDLRALAGRAILDIPEQKAVTKSGEVRIQHIRKVPIFDEHGQPQLLVSIAEDITDLKVAEKTLRQSEEKYRNLVETSRDLIWSADSDGCLTFINQAVKQIYGYEPEEMLGRRLAEFFGPLHTGKGVAFFREMLTRDRTIPDYECQALRKDGTPVILSSNAVVLRDERGRMTGVTGVSKDVTRQKRAEQALRDSEERFRQLAENIRDVFWIATPGLDKVLYVSTAFEEIWGMSLDDVYRDPLAWQRVIHPEDLPSVRVTFDKIIRGEATAIEYRLVRPDGSVRWIWGRSYSITTSDGTRLPCGIAEDITDRKRMEAERLAREVAQRETLVKEVHHRIKNHLQGIAGLLRQKVKGNPAFAPLVESAVAELQSVAAAFGLRANLESGNAELKPMLEAIIASVQGATGGRVSLAYGINEREQALVADSEKVPLALALNELVFNALKHSSERGRKKNARISVRKQAGSYRITVTNKGKLTPGFDFARGRGIGSGLDLVRSLLPPKDATLVIGRDGDRVAAVLTLKHPVIVVGEPALPHHHNEAPHVFAAMR